MKTKQYIISLLDLYNNRRQCGLFYLQTNMPPVNIGKMFGTPMKLKKLLSDRWELHFQVMSSCILSDVENSFSHSVVGTIKKITERLSFYETLQSRTILLPTNNPPGAHSDY